MLCYDCFLYNARKGILEFLAPIGAQASMNYYVSLLASSCFIKALNLPLDNDNKTLSLLPSSPYRIVGAWNSLSCRCSAIYFEKTSSPFLWGIKTFRPNQIKCLGIILLKNPWQNFHFHRAFPKHRLGVYTEICALLKVHANSSSEHLVK